MRDIPVGNGRLLVTFDDRYRIRDIYFPHVGQENHTEGYPSRFGVWVDGEFSWIDEDGWSRELKYLPETLVSDVLLRNESLGLEIVSRDTVASHEDIFLRHVRVVNNSDHTRNIRVFLHQDFRIYENKVGDTALYDPDTSALIHYKKHRYFLIATEPTFNEFTTGRKAFRDQEGSWRDAEDGVLARTAITEGSVDSTLSVHRDVDAGGSFDFYYWIAAGPSYPEVAALNGHVMERRAQQYFDYTENYWRAWVNKNETYFDDLKPEIVDMYKRSLLIVQTQTDHDGAFIAANDSDVSERATDHYSYLWTRDGAFVGNALDLAGYPYLSRRFFELCGRIVHRNGYFVQKYNADGSLASSWHSAWDPWTGEKLIPIQEDETALVLWALWEHYDKYRDIQFVHGLYRKMIVPCADFMKGFREESLGLPKASWNLWEDRVGIHTFTCATVVAGLRAAAKFATLFAEHERSAAYESAAAEIVDGMATHLYSEPLGRFLRSITLDPNGSIEEDATIDASLFGIFYFDCFDALDPRVVSTMEAVREGLWSGTGIARYENDGYMRTAEGHPGNAWFICTLWLAEHYIATARTEEDLAPALELLSSVASAALPSGVLAEQIDPATGHHVSVSPLTWSHSTFVATTSGYLRKWRELRPDEPQMPALHLRDSLPGAEFPHADKK